MGGARQSPARAIVQGAVLGRSVKHKRQCRYRCTGRRVSHLTQHVHLRQQHTCARTSRGPPHVAQASNSPTPPPTPLLTLIEATGALHQQPAVSKGQRGQWPHAPAQYGRFGRRNGREIMRTEVGVYALAGARYDEGKSWVRKGKSVILLLNVCDLEGAERESTCGAGRGEVGEGRGGCEDLE